MKRKKVIGVTKTEFELEDGTIYQHPTELDVVPTPEEFQTYYDYWFKFFEEMIGESETSENRSSLKAA